MMSNRGSYIPEMAWRFAHVVRSVGHYVCIAGSSATQVYIDTAVRNPDVYEVSDKMRELSNTGNNEDVDIFCVLDSRVLLHEIKYFKEQDTPLSRKRRKYREDVQSSMPNGSRLENMMVDHLMAKIRAVAGSVGIAFHIQIPPNDVRTSISSRRLFSYFDRMANTKNMVATSKFDIECSYTGEKCPKPINLVILNMYPHEDRPCMGACDWGWGVVNGFDIDVCKAFIPIYIDPYEVEYLADTVPQSLIDSSNYTDEVHQYLCVPVITFLCPPLDSAQVVVADDCKKAVFAGEFTILVGFGDTPISAIRRIHKYERKGYRLVNFNCKDTLMYDYAYYMWDRINFYMSLRQVEACCVSVTKLESTEYNDIDVDKVAEVIRSNLTYTKHFECLPKHRHICSILNIISSDYELAIKKHTSRWEDTLVAMDKYKVAVAMKVIRGYYMRWRNRKFGITREFGEDVLVCNDMLMHGYEFYGLGSRRWNTRWFFRGLRFRHSYTD